MTRFLLYILNDSLLMSLSSVITKLRSCAHEKDVSLTLISLNLSFLLTNYYSIAQKSALPSLNMGVSFGVWCSQC